MNDIELLDLITRGDNEVLLLQKNLTGRLNGLAAKGLIDICDGRILLTPKGEQIQKERNLMILENIKVQEEMQEFSGSTYRRNLWYIYFCLLLLFIATFYLFLLTGKGL